VEKTSFSINNEKYKFSRTSTKMLIQLDDPAIKAFNELKENLIAQVELV